MRWSMSNSFVLRCGVSTVRHSRSSSSQVEHALDLFPGVVLLKKESGPRDVVLPVQLVIITTAAIGWKQFKEEVPSSLSAAPKP
jgi:hypothetical protein